MWEEKIMEFGLRAMAGEALANIRGDLGNYVNLFWPSFAHWSCILWEPQGFSEMAYEMSKHHGESMKEMMAVAPWHQRLLFQALMPKNAKEPKQGQRRQKTGAGFSEDAEGDEHRHLGIP